MLLKRGAASGEERENNKQEQTRDLETKLLVVGLGSKLGFIPICHFPVPHARAPAPRSPF